MFLVRNFSKLKPLAVSGGVTEGDLGGYLESESNLSHYGKAWVSGEARVYGKAQVYGEAHVLGEAQVYGDARVSGVVWVSGEAHVFGEAYVLGEARVFGEARVYGDAQVSGNVLNFATNIWVATFTDNLLIIGCQAHPYEHWFGFNDDEIREMDKRALEWWKQWKPSLLEISKVLRKGD